MGWLVTCSTYMQHYQHMPPFLLYHKIPGVVHLLNINQRLSLEHELSTKIRSYNHYNVENIASEVGALAHLQNHPPIPTFPPPIVPRDIQPI
jgi:hypothetical protein